MVLSPSFWWGRHHLTGWDTWPYRDRDGITIWKHLHHWPNQLMDGCWRLQHHFPFPKREEGTHSETPNAICLMKLSVSVKILRFKVWWLLHGKWSCYCRFLLRYGNYSGVKSTIFLALSTYLIGRVEVHQNRLSLTELGFLESILRISKHWFLIFDFVVITNHLTVEFRDWRTQQSCTEWAVRSMLDSHSFCGLPTLCFEYHVM